MTNINNNKINTNNTGYTQKSIAKKANNEVTQSNQQPVITENTNSDYSAIIGRSQVKFKSQVDNLENDIQHFVNNPKKVERANTFFNIAYEQACKSNKRNPYEYSALLAREYYNLSSSDK